MKKDTIRTVIIDDEKSSRELLRNLLQQYCPSVEILGEADSKNTGKTLINEIKPDLIFLDIEMPFGSGFDLIQEIEMVNAEVVFITAYDHYALKALKISALDYLLKPVHGNELLQAIAKFKKKDPRITRDVLTLLADRLESNSAEVKRIGISSVKGISIVKVEDIMYCEADGNYTNFKLVNDEVHKASKTLKEYENILPSSSFIRTHQKYLVNINYVIKYLKGRGGFVMMKDGKVLDVSEAKKPALLKAIGGQF